MHSEKSAATIAGKTTSARKWNVCYGSLLKRGHLGSESPEGYPGPSLSANEPVGAAIED